MNADLIIRNADLADGTGAPVIRADLAVRDGKIEAFGPKDEVLGRLATPATNSQEDSV